MPTSSPDASPVSPDPPLRVARRRLRPNGRAVVGGLLVTAAAVGVIAGSVGDDGARHQPVVVLREAVDAGEVVGADDVVVERAALPSSARSQTFGSVDEVVGLVAIAPLVTGDVVRRSALDEADAPRGGAERRRPEVSVALERDRALSGHLRRGEAVDVIATYGAGGSAVTSVVAAGAVVRSLEEGGSDTLGSSGVLVVTLALTDPGEVLAVAHAADAAAVRVVRASADRSEGAVDEVPASYRGPDTDVGPGGGVGG